MKRILITLVLMTFLLINISATQQTFGTFKINEEISLIQTCSNCTFNNITAIISPNSTKVVENVIMTKQGTFYNYTFSGVNQKGEYIINGIGDLDGVITIWSYNLFVTKTGTEFNISEAVTYFILAFGVLLLFMISFYFMIVTPYSNIIDGENGAVIQLTKLKYVKLGLILLTWVLFTWFLNILIGLADNFVNLTMYYGFFGFIFDVMNRLALPLGIVIIVIALFEVIKDSNIQGNINKLGRG